MSNPVAPLDVYLVHQGELADGLAGVLAERLRDENLRVVLHSGGGSFKSQMKKADASGALCALIIGDDEAQSGQATLKPLRGGGEQLRVAQSELPQMINKVINKG
jgi:histidyl-tRNA synthetase